VTDPEPEATWAASAGVHGDDERYQERVRDRTIRIFERGPA
jgi:hypothetical protein